MYIQTRYPNLAASLGTSRTDRVNMAIRPKYIPSTNRVRTLHNPHQQRCAYFLRLSDNKLIEDIVVGVCTLDHGSGGNLSPTRLFAVMSYMESISSEHIADVLNLSDRQARRYMAAVKLIIIRLTQHLKPRVLIRREPTLAELRQRLKNQTQQECA